MLKCSYHLSSIVLQKAEAQLAYELQAAKIQQRIKQEELQIQVQHSDLISSSLSGFRAYPMTLFLKMRNNFNKEKRVE